MKDGIPFYVLSTGRAGSTFLARMLESIGEFSHDLHQQPFSRSVNIRSNKVFGNTEAEMEFLNTYRGLFPSATPSSTCDPLQSMSLFYYLKYEHPQAKVVHLVRDPRDMIASFMNWKNRKLSGRIAHHLVPYWMPVPMQNNSMNLVQYTMLPKYAHYAWIWDFKNTLFSELNESSDYALFRLEDLRSSEQEMNRLLDHIGLPQNASLNRLRTKVNQNESKGFPDWRQWTPDMCRRVNSICGTQMNRLGYGNEPEWTEKLNVQ